MLSPDATLDEYRADLKRLNKPFMEAGCIDCIECHTLLTAWLAGEVKTREVCAHIQGCPTSQARLAQAITAGAASGEGTIQTQTLKGGSASTWLGNRDGVFSPELAAERLLEGVEA